MKLLLRIFLLLAISLFKGYSSGYAHAGHAGKHISAKRQQIQIVLPHSAESYSLAPFAAEDDHVSDYFSETEDENDETHETICVKGKCPSNYFGTFYGKAPPYHALNTKSYLSFYKHFSFSLQNTHIVFRSIRI